MNNLKEIIEKLNEDYEQTLKQGTAEAQERLLTILDELQALIREKIQDLTREDMRKIIYKLKNGQELSAHDLDQVRLWIVGDAQEYAKSEQDCQRRQSELQDIMTDIKHLQDGENILADYSRFRLLLRKASRVLSEVFYFQQQKERVDKFDQTGQQISAADRPFLIRILEQKMNSSEF